MTLLGKYIVVAALAAGGFYFLIVGVRSVMVNVHRLRSWNRFPATFRAAIDPTTVEVLVGSEQELTTLKVGRTYEADYMGNSMVTVLENPGKPEERRLTGFFDLWNETLIATIFGLVFLAGAGLVGRTNWGVDAVWGEGAWKEVPAARESLEMEFEVHEPGQSWKANLLFGCIFGLAFGLPAFLAKGVWKPWPAIVAALSVAFIFWMIQSAVMNYTRTVCLSKAGLEEQSFFGARRIPWQELGGLEFQRVRSVVQNRQSIGRQESESWVAKDRDGREVFSLSPDMTPAENFQKMRAHIERRIKAEKSVQDADGHR
jgi:hypothetical protein